MFTIDIVKAFSYPLKDEKFAYKLLILSLLMVSCVLFIPIFFVVPFLTGYSINTIRNIQNSKWKLADLDDKWMVYFQEGLFISIAFIVACCIFYIPLQIISAVLSNSESESIIIVLLNLFVSILSIIVSLILSILMTNARVLQAKTQDKMAFTNISGHISLIKNNWLNYIVYCIVVGIACFPLMFIGILACCIGVIPASVYLGFISSGFEGQFKVDADNKSEGNVKEAQVEAIN